MNDITEEKWCIYIHINKINNKVYVGQTKHQENLNRRFYTDGSGYKPDKKSNQNRKFWNAIQKYGWDNFEHKVLEKDIPTLELANEREKFWIRYYDSFHNGYNMTLGGDGTKGMSGVLNPFYGRTHTLETRQKLREKNIGKPSAFKGHHFSEESKKKLSIKQKERFKNIYNHPSYGKHLSEEHKAKVGKCHSIAIYALDDNMDIVFEFESSIKASQYFKCGATSITNAISNGIEYTSQGYHWCKKEEYEEKRKNFKKTKNRSSTIFQYGMDGFFIKSFSSAKSAELQTGIFATSILACCNNRQKYAGDFQWRKYKVKQLLPIQKHYACIKAVCQFDKNMNYINIYNSITEAATVVGCQNTGISACLCGKQKTAGGYIWKYADEIEESNLAIAN